MIWLITFWRGVALRLFAERAQVRQQLLVDEVEEGAERARLQLRALRRRPGAAQSRQR